jgi:hypothetical protein
LRTGKEQKNENDRKNVSFKKPKSFFLSAVRKKIFPLPILKFWQTPF